MGKPRDTANNKSAGKADRTDGDRPHASRHADEIALGYYTKELGRPLQRKLLQARLDDFSHHNIHAASHGEDTQAPMTPPRDDRAG